MFIDTSVIVAILGNEDDAADWSRKLAESAGKVTSALVILEAAMRLSSLLNVDAVSAGQAISALLQQADIDVVPIDADEVGPAILAFATYGKGRGHPAQLNLADCLSYACAKRRGLSLLYKGNDFAKTDLA